MHSFFGLFAVTILLEKTANLPTVKDGPKIAEPGQFPHHAVIIPAEFPDFMLCQGFVISDRLIVTTAECLDNRTPNNTAVVLGVHDWRIGGTRYDLSHVSRNRFWIKEYRSQDTGIVQTIKPITFTKFIQPIISSPMAFNQPVGRIARVTGFHLDSLARSTPTYLKYIDVQVWSLRECRQRIVPWLLGEFVHSANACAAALTGQGLSRTDIGSAMVFENKAIAMGVFATSAIGEGAPDVYERSWPRIIRN
uniref:Putative chymotrypsin-1-like protein n=1 Tax=Lutzomyia longipalpis TaxID=7200 RepID=A0A1B0GHZ1_LUTLO